MPKKYRVTLTAEERQELERLLFRGKADVRCLKHAQILLKADEAEGGSGWSDARIADAFDAGVATIERLRQRFVELPPALAARFTLAEQAVLAVVAAEHRKRGDCRHVGTGPHAHVEDDAVLRLL